MLESTNFHRFCFSNETSCLPSNLNVITNAIEKAKKQKRNALLMLVNFEGSNRFVAVEIF